MGLSSFQPGRRIADWPQDVLAFADGLGLSADQTEDLVHACPGAKLHRCPGEGHLVMVSHAEEILRKAAGR